MKRIISFVTCLSWVLLANVALAQSSSFRVVVHESSPEDSMSKAAVSRLFLKKTKHWSNGDAVAAVDQEPDSSVREAFSEDVHGKGVSAIRSLWQRQIFSGKGTPPPEFDSDRAVLAYVRSTIGAVGYVSANASLGDGVKVLRVTE